MCSLWAALHYAATLYNPDFSLVTWYVGDQGHTVTVFFPFVPQVVQLIVSMIPAPYMQGLHKIPMIETFGNEAHF